MKNLFEYLPELFEEINEFKSIFSVIQRELELLMNCVNTVANDNFIESSSVNGLKRFAKSLNLDEKYLSASNLRFLLNTVMMDKRPYTLKMINNLLLSICENNGFVIDCDTDNECLYVKLNLGNKDKFDILFDFLDRIVPANMYLSVDYLYNPYSLYHGAMYASLNEYTYSELKSSEQMKEVFA